MLVKLLVSKVVDLVNIFQKEKGGGCLFNDDKQCVCTVKQNHENGCHK
jgi:hypothetical protein